MSILHYFRSFSVGTILPFLFSPLTPTMILGIFSLFRNFPETHCTAGNTPMVIQDTAVKRAGPISKMLT